MQRFLLFAFCIFNFVFLSAQQFGGNPPSLKWKQINTDSARIIFPAGLDSQANRVASIILYLASNSSANSKFSLGNQLRKVNLVLQNQTTVGNAYVSLGPFRSEFFLTPIFNNFEEGSISWPDLLAVHEYRHVMQFNNFRNGLSKLMYTLFGEDGLDLAINASVPDWFYEGDAVYNETALTNQGRGRLPLFLNAYRSLWQAKKNYSWMKLRNGSLKDYVPDHYYLGYLLVNYGREKYGADFWTKVTHDASAFKGLIYPFQKAVKKYSGVDYKTFYEQAFNYYQSNSDMQLKSATQGTIIQGTEAGIKNITVANKHFLTNYTFPYEIGDDSLLYMRSSYRYRPAFYIKNKMGEHKLRIRDISIDRQYSYRNGKIVYAAYETDARWGWKDYSVIKLLDVKTGEQKTITHKTKYFTPDISADGSKIAAVQVETSGKCELNILDASTGKVVNTISSSEVSLYTDPKFIDENSLVTAVRLKDGKMSLAIVDIDAGSTVRLTPPSFNVVGYPCVNNGMIYFTASYLGNDDVFALRLEDKRIFRITNGATGNYFVNAYNGKITWSSFTADGYQLRQIDEKGFLPMAIGRNELNIDSIEKLASVFPVNLPISVGTNKSNDILLNKVPHRNFPVSDYKKGTNLLNFHSWRPYYSNPEFFFSLYGENILNTLQTELYYRYNRDEKTNAVGFSTIYGAWFPYLSMGAEYTFDRQDRIGNRIRQWDQLDTRIGLSIPLNFVSGQTFKQLYFGTDYFYRNEFNKGFYKDSLGNINYTYLHHFLYWSQQVQQAVQHIYPKLGYSISLDQRHAITKYKSWQFLGQTSLYLPGFFSTHSIVFTGAYQETDTLNILFSNLFPYSRGYNEAYFARMWGITGNYHFPIVYPDWGFGNIVYLQQVRGNIFYDYMKVYSADKKHTRDQRSAGGEIYIDTKWWNQYPITFGIRVSRLLDDDFFTHAKGTVFEFVLPVSIIPK